LVCKILIGWRDVKENKASLPPSPSSIARIDKICEKERNVIVK
jgi:hypothetical protein